MRHRGNRHEITLAGNTFWVDSNQEEMLLRWLEGNGFQGRWRRLDDGLSVGHNNYTPDLELSVQFDGMTHRALVESKPSKRFFTDYVSGRMRGVTRHYFSDVLLLYVHDEKKWYRVDKKTGMFSDFSPVPGEILINKIYRPFTKKARSVRYHRYRKRLELGKMAVGLLADTLDFGVKALFERNQKRRRTRKRKKH